MFLLNLILLLGVVAASAAVSLPAGIKPCKNDDKLNECVLKTSKTAIPNLIKGDPKFKIPPLDPLKIQRLYVQTGNNKNFFLNMTFTNLNIIGLKDAWLTNVDYDLEKKVMKETFTTKEAKLVSDYEMNGKALVPVSGKGKTTIYLNEPQCSIATYFSTVKKNGEDYMHLDDLKYSCDLKKLRVNFENLFNGNKELGDNVNQMLNDNWREVADNVIPAFSEALFTIIKNILNDITTNIPYKDLFV